MATLTVYNQSGSEVGSYDLDWKDVAPRISRQLLHDAVVMYQANLRQGSHKTKSRGEVAGSTRKLYRQKGTGNARAGSRRTNVRRGGGMAFAKRPRDYGHRMPKKALRIATRMAIASKLRDDQILIIDELSFDAPKTQDMAAVLGALGLAGRTTVVATAEYDQNVYKSGRNIAGVTVAPVAELNALAVLGPQRMLVTRAALDVIANRSSGGPQEKGEDMSEGGEQAGGEE